MFTLPEYCAPDFFRAAFTKCAQRAHGTGPADGAAPAGYHATGMYPEYYKVDGVWRLAEKNRMDCVPVLAPDGNCALWSSAILCRATAWCWAARTMAARAF